MDALLAKLDRWSGFDAVVVGDFMLDELWFGNADRLSADAPVPILDVERKEHRAGGAANLCLDLVALGGRVLAIGVIGDDSEGQTLAKALQIQGVETAGLVIDPSRPTTVKRNLIGLAQARHPQKMFRVDSESREEISAEVVEQMAKIVAERVAHECIVCIEDYAKGVCSPAMCSRVIESSRASDRPIFVDPASITDYSKYARATAITPNRTEAEKATGMRTHADASPAHNAELARILRDTLDLDAVVLTLDRHGALLLERGATEPIPVPTVAREVYDVTGAGDMMLAALAAARANDLTWEESVRFANTAAGLEVEIFGVEPIPLERIHRELLREARPGGLRSIEDVLIEIRGVRATGGKIVFTNGCFDILHTGHIQILEEAAELGDLLVVGLNDDASIARLKGPTRPVNTLADRARVLGALRSVGMVVPFGEDTPISLIRAITPEVLVKGADYADKEVVGRDVVEAAGGKVVLVDLVEGKSTTGTIESMAHP